MKNNIFIPILSALLLLVTGSCSDISEDERFIVIDSVAPQRAVLLEDFTGQDCPNCPSAHVVIDGLVSQYGDAVIPVAIHAGSMAISCTARRPGLMQPEGNTYNDRYGIDEWPKGIVNGNSGRLNPDEWSDAVRSAVQLPASLGIELTATVGEISDDNPGVISVDCKLRPSADIQGVLSVWVLEDGIVARQRDIDRGLISDYVHNHVYRAAVNDVEGENVTLQANVHKDLTYTIPVRVTEKETWNVANLSIVAFVRQADGGVAQAARCKVLQTGSDDAAPEK